MPTPSTTNQYDRIYLSFKVPSNVIIMYAHPDGSTGVANDTDNSLLWASNDQSQVQHSTSYDQYQPVDESPSDLSNSTYNVSSWYNQSYPYSYSYQTSSPYNYYSSSYYSADYQV